MKRKTKTCTAIVLAILILMSFVPNIWLWNLYLRIPRIYRVSAIETGKINLADVAKLLNRTIEEINQPLLDQLESMNESEREELEKITKQEEITYTYNKTMQRTEWLFNNTMLLEVWVEDLEAIIDFQNGTQRHPVCYMRQYLPIYRPTYYLTNEYSPCYEGPLQTYYWDDVLFLKAPGNATERVAYDHPHNYRGGPYHPEEWYVGWSMWGKDKKHIHLSYDFIENWIRSEEYTKVITVFGLAMLVAFGSLLPVLSAAKALVIPPAWCTVIGIANAIGSALIALIQLRGWSRVDFIKHVVRAHHGDGWKWEWGYQVIDLGIPVGPGCTSWKAITYYESWGAERDNPILVYHEYYGKGGGGRHEYLLY